MNLVAVQETYGIVKYEYESFSVSFSSLDLAKLV